MRVKEESEKVGFKLSVQKTKILASGLITSWLIEAKKKKKVGIVTDFIFLGSKVTVDSDFSHEMERCLHLGRNAMTNLGSILKIRDIILPTEVHVV